MYHTIIIVGNLGRDPEMRYTPSGLPVTSFSVASNRTFTRDNQQVKETIWFKVTTWGKQAETCNNYLKKGSKVLIEGRLTPGDNGSPRMWTAQDGTSRSSYEVTANTVRFLSSRGGEDEMPDAMIDDGGGDDNIPF
jgi:single-strand DNA-binding protein